MLATTRPRRRYACWQRLAGPIWTQFVDVLLHTFHAVLGCSAVLCKPCLCVLLQHVFLKAVSENVCCTGRLPQKIRDASQLHILLESRPLLLDSLGLCLLFLSVFCQLKDFSSKGYWYATNQKRGGSKA